ncbi:hypothetical protein Bca4012_058112 [Brassica carinata]
MAREKTDRDRDGGERDRERTQRVGGRRSPRERTKRPREMTYVVFRRNLHEGERDQTRAVQWPFATSPSLTDSRKPKLRVSNELVCYENPSPTSGIHRVALILFRQLGRQTVFAPQWRQRFNTREFAENYNLGLPVAAVYFDCQRENGCGGRRTSMDQERNAHVGENGGHKHLAQRLS